MHQYMENKELIKRAAIYARNNQSDNKSIIN
jgi:hypothetical protein